MSDYQINGRRNWKGQVFNYDEYLPDTTQECLYCLTEKQAEIVRGIIEPLAWTTRWWSGTDTPIDTDVITAFRDDIVRRLMMGCCGDEIPVQYRYSDTGVLQRSEDGGVTFTDAPAYDPRQNSPEFPPVPGPATLSKKCIAATGAADLIKEQVGDQLTDGMSRYTLGQLITDWVKTMIDTSNPFEALLTVITNQIFALVIATLRPALTTTVYHLLQCILYCRMANDITFDDARWASVRSDITDQIGGIAGIFLEHLVYLLGPRGLTNIVRSGSATSGDCSDCSACLSCNERWSIGGDDPTHFHGTIDSIGDDFIICTSGSGGSNNYLIIVTPDVDTCCVIASIELLSGTAPSLYGWDDCGQTQAIGAPSHLDPFGVGSGCINYLQLQSGSGPAFTVKLTFADCP